MKLSEAIKIGAKKREQGFSDFFVKIYDNFDNICFQTCALGAAYEGYEPEIIKKVEKSHKDNTYSYYHIKSHLFTIFPELAELIPDNLNNKKIRDYYDRVTDSKDFPIRLIEYVVYLNDILKLSRTQIANRLAKAGY